MLAKQVSPPTSGRCIAMRMEAMGGAGMYVLSACQLSAPSPLGAT